MNYGSTDEFGYHAIDKPVHMHDLHATTLHLLGLDHTQLTYRYSGRDFRLTDVGGNVLRGIIAGPRALSGCRKLTQTRPPIWRNSMSTEVPMPRLINSSRFLLFIVSVSLLASGCGSKDKGGKTKKSKSGDSTAEYETYKPAKTGLLGKPSMVGVLDGGTVVTNSVRGEYEFIVASGAREYLLAVKMPFEFPTRTEDGRKMEKGVKFAPSDYRAIVVHDDDEEEPTKYEPIAVAFGAKKQFWSTKAVLGETIDLLPGNNDTPGAKDGKILGYMLSVPQYILLYRLDVKRYDEVAIHHDRKSFAIDLEEADDSEWLAGFESTTDLGAAVDDFNKERANSDESVKIEIEKGELRKAKIEGEDEEVYELTFKISAPVAKRVDINRRDLFLKGDGDKRTTEMFLKMDGSRMRMHAGAEFFEVSYDGEIMTELVNGDVEVKLTPGFSVPLRIVFPNPPFEGGLWLNFPNEDPVELIAADEALGEIRPAFNEALIQVPQAPILGKPVRVRYIDSKIEYMKDLKTQEIASIQAAPGNRFLALKLDVHPGEQRFVSRDYRVEDSTQKSYTPKAFAFGGYPALLPSDEFTNVKVIAAEQDEVPRRRGVVQSLNHSKPVWVVVFEVPETETKFGFAHGSTQLTLQPPAKTVMAWNAFRPTTANVGGPNMVGKTDPNVGGTKPATPDPGEGLSAEDKLKKAESRMKTVPILMKRSPARAKTYLEEVIKLVPGTDLAKEAAALLKTIKD